MDSGILENILTERWKAINLWRTLLNVVSTPLCQPLSLAVIKVKPITQALCALTTWTTVDTALMAAMVRGTKSLGDIRIDHFMNGSIPLITSHNNARVSVGCPIPEIVEMARNCRTDDRPERRSKSALRVSIVGIKGK